MTTGQETDLVEQGMESLGSTYRKLHLSWHQVSDVLCHALQ